MNQPKQQSTRSTPLSHRSLSARDLPVRATAAFTALGLASVDASVDASVNPPATALGGSRGFANCAVKLCVCESGDGWQDTWFPCVCILVYVVANQGKGEATLWRRLSPDSMHN